METIVFFKYLGLTTLSLLLIFGVYYWIRTALNKFFPNRKFWFKYKVLRRKFNEDVMNFLAEDLENGVDINEIFKAILMSGKATPSQAKELKYIYKELQGRYEKK